VANGETKTVAAPGVFIGAHGVLLLGPNGAYTYLVNNNDPAVLALSAPTDSTTDTFTYAVKDAAGLTSSATLTVTIKGQTRLAPPPPHDHDHDHDHDEGHHDEGHHGDSFGMVTNVQGQGGNGFPGFSNLGFTPGSAVYAIRADIDPTIGLDGKIDFKLPLLALEAPLGGDIVSVTARLSDGRPLPSWLRFDGNSGQFAGLVPDDILTGSLPPAAGGVPGAGAGAGGMAVPDTITIEVIARNAKGDISILDFTLDLTGKNPIKTGRHGWNLPNGRTFDPWTLQRAGGGALRDVAIPASWDRASDHVPHGRGHDMDDPGAHQVPAGRAGLSAQLATLGSRGIDSGRTALLDSLRHAR
jgi:VCBS repeat-containing protein